ncbi:hypothetical protein [Bradyrhizobium sp. C9]|uniref:hypothetical protein n=1 Tax=Bradyrhizobium sp. C9 TaxID=142585 RepID=UPI001178330C|nr:hypothetical protein [Bradyrhizobium sp. C9]
MPKLALALKTAIVGLLLLSSVDANAARLDVGPRTCSNQRDQCVAYRFRIGPVGSQETCLTVFRSCMRSGVWDGATAFPYGGARITGMIRR